VNRSYQTTLLLVPQQTPQTIAQTFVVDKFGLKPIQNQHKREENLRLSFISIAMKCIKI
jgi:hypothetical protein